MGVEPTIFCATSRRFRPLSYSRHNRGDYITAVKIKLGYKKTAHNHLDGFSEINYQSACKLWCSKSISL